MERINKACSFYPCHDVDKLQDCTFCYCPKYPCEDTGLGKYLENGNWDCSKCTFPHDKEKVDQLFMFLKQIL